MQYALVGIFRRGNEYFMSNNKGTLIYLGNEYYIYA